jgi:hypothetical protein
MSKSDARGEEIANREERIVNTGAHWLVDPAAGAGRGRKSQ